MCPQEIVKRCWQGTSGSLDCYSRVLVCACRVVGLRELSLQMDTPSKVFESVTVRESGKWIDGEQKSPDGGSPYIVLTSLRFMSLHQLPYLPFQAIS